jgi:hypothetical protein
MGYQVIGVGELLLIPRIPSEALELWEHTLHENVMAVIIRPWGRCVLDKVDVGINPLGVVRNGGEMFTNSRHVYLDANWDEKVTVN